MKCDGSIRCDLIIETELPMNRRRLLHPGEFTRLKPLSNIWRSHYIKILIGSLQRSVSDFLRLVSAPWRNPWSSLAANAHRVCDELVAPESFYSTR